MICFLSSVPLLQPGLVQQLRWLRRFSLRRQPLHRRSCQSLRCSCQPLRRSCQPLRSCRQPLLLRRIPLHCCCCQTWINFLWRAKTGITTQRKKSKNIWIKYIFWSFCTTEHEMSWFWKLIWFKLVSVFLFFQRKKCDNKNSSLFKLFKIYFLLRNF